MSRVNGYKIPSLPLSIDFDKLPIYKKLNQASRALAELKGNAPVVPNPAILINTLALQEARASSAIEQIYTTQDAMFKVDGVEFISRPEEKEVSLYRDALKFGFEELRATDGLLRNNTLIRMYQILTGRGDEFRKLPGTVIANPASGNIVYTPPQKYDEIVKNMTELEAFIHAEDAIDPLIKMAIIHHQFESIHPFSDGNGRLGRILNVLYMTKSGLLKLPILYMSRSIIAKKSEYYRLLQAIRETDNGQNAWHDWIIYMLEAVAETAGETLIMVERIQALMMRTKKMMRSQLDNIYSQELLNNIFSHPYTRIEFVEQELKVTRPTASSYLKALVDVGILAVIQQGNKKYYINVELVQLFLEREYVAQDGENSDI